MTSSFLFTIKSELVMSEEQGIVSLTKKLNIWQTIKAKWSENIQMSKINFSFKSRAGPLAEGIVTASIIDNRTRSDISDNTLRSISFAVTQDVLLSWDYDVNFHIEDLNSNKESPLILATDISECNIKPGYSLGQILVIIEMTTSNKMMMKVSKSPIIKLFRDHKIKEDDRRNRRVSLEALEVKNDKPITIKGNNITDGIRSNSVMEIPRKKYFVSTPSKEY